MISSNPFLFTCFLMTLISMCHAVTLTYKIAAQERACFYTDSQVINEKFAFYFAVQSGGQFDIDWEVLSPTGELVHGGSKARQGDYIFPSKEVGEYAFCFSNSMSTFSQKIVDFDISAEHEMKSESFTQNKLPHPVPGVAEKKEAVVQATLPVTLSLEALERGIQEYQHTQKWFRTREHRNFATVVSTEERIFWFSFIEMGVIIVIAVLQVYVIQIFFNKASKFRV